MAAQSRTTKRATQRRPQRRGERPLDPVILKIAEKIAREYQPEKIILFGSHAWGTPGPGSDVDLFIVKSGLRIPKHMRTTDVDRILDRAPAAWDALVYTPDEIAQRVALGDFFIRRILREGRILYERDYAA